MKILFLGYVDCRLLTFLRNSNHVVTQTMRPLKHHYVAEFDLVLSFGYRYILVREILAHLKRPAINLHISLLPWNRGADPNYWSFAENTPKGVSIHEIDEGIDTGPIIYQQAVDFTAEQNTLALTYQHLINEIQDLFILHALILLAGTYTTRPQIGHGSYHPVTELHLSNGWQTATTEVARD